MGELLSMDDYRDRRDIFRVALMRHAILYVDLDLEEPATVTILEPRTEPPEIVA